MFDFITRVIGNKLNFNNITQQILGYINKCFGKLKDVSHLDPKSTSVT